MIRWCDLRLRQPNAAAHMPACCAACCVEAVYCVGGCAIANIGVHVHAVVQALHSCIYGARQLQVPLPLHR